MSHWYSEGQLTETVAIDDRAVQYGDGLFETVAIRNGEPRLLDRHLARLRAGCGRLGIAMPEETAVERQLIAAVNESGEFAGHCVAKILVSSGIGKRGYGRRQPTPARVSIGVFPARPVAVEHYRKGVSATVCETRLATPSVLAGLKTLNRLEQVLGRSECIEKGAFEGLMLDADDNLICGTMSNVFIVNDSDIATPVLDECGVAGVMRALAIDLLRDQGARVDERRIARRELLDCDEAFLTNSQFGVLPIATLDDHTWDRWRRTREVMDLLAANGIKECAP